MKKIISLLLCGVMLLSVSGCGEEEKKDEYYSGVSVNKTSDGVLIEVDLLNGGSTYLFDETFLYESQDKDLSWESVSEMAENSYLTCKLK